jgi:hypothetical protein
VWNGGHEGDVYQGHLRHTQGLLVSLQQGSARKLLIKWLTEYLLADFCFARPELRWICDNDPKLCQPIRVS